MSVAIFDLFSSRAAKHSKGELDVYQYDDIPEKLRVQVHQILLEILGDPDAHENEYGTSDNIQSLYTEIVKILRREHGVMTLNSSNRSSGDRFMEEYMNFILTQNSPEKFFDGLEIGLIAAHAFCREYRYRQNSRAQELYDETIREINYRMREAGVGYEYIDREIIRIDSELIHAEAVKPALSFLNGAEYDGPREEFLKAHSHYRSGHHKEAIVECLKAFESTMKTICDKRQWAYDKGKATAKDLIAVCLDKGLIPSYWQNSIANLKALLESSVPTGRNKTSGHGQGALPVNVDEPVVEYIMHMTASTILFLAKAEKNLP
ncbi:STM4504/CBY_0614 family protein [Endobacterium cereale]|uniref:STM4504/CBY_0614 family protein n=1 Tax=Endobacterium cereale TaxID=2663029 RepID=UPI002B46C4DD|nr:hypothetical protein [Endobacterium cereale]MEB2845912.1 hypothetical protein [Endobacterium cereale]